MAKKERMPKEGCKKCGDKHEKMESSKMGYKCGGKVGTHKKGK